MTRPTLIPAMGGGALFALLGVVDGADALALARLTVAGAALAAAALVDLRERRIPNRIVLPAVLVCACLAGPAMLRLGLLALVVVGVLLALALLRPAALGMGDVKLALLVAVALGAAATPALLVGLALAALAGLSLALRRGRSALQSAIPLAPFLTVAAAISLLAA